jgi:hypothetical protein
MTMAPTKPPFEGSVSDPAEFAQLLAQSMEELRLKTTAHDGSWHIGDAAWAVDQGERTIVFTTPQGIVATAPVQIIGSFNSDDGSWLWAWDNASVVPELQTHASTVYHYGEARSIDRLTTPKFDSSMEEAWEFTALACKLNDAQGAYSGPAGAMRVFMTFGEVTLRGTEERIARHKAEDTTL